MIIAQGKCASNVSREFLLQMNPLSRHPGFVSTLPVFESLVTGVLDIDKFAADREVCHHSVVNQRWSKNERSVSWNCEKSSCSKNTLLSSLLWFIDTANFSLEFTHLWTDLIWHKTQRFWQPLWLFNLYTKESEPGTAEGLTLKLLKSLHNMS